MVKFDASIRGPVLWGAAGVNNGRSLGEGEEKRREGERKKRREGEEKKRREGEEKKR